MRSLFALLLWITAVCPTQANDFRSRLAAMRARHGKPAVSVPRLSDPRLQDGFDAEDKAKLRKLKAAKSMNLAYALPPKGQWVPVEELRVGDSVFLTVKSRKVSRVEGADVFVDVSPKHQGIPVRSDWWGSLAAGSSIEGPIQVRKVPSASEGGIGKSGYLMYRTGNFETLSKTRIVPKYIQENHAYYAKYLEKFPILADRQPPVPGIAGQWVSVDEIAIGDIVIRAGQKKIVAENDDDFLRRPNRFEWGEPQWKRLPVPPKNSNGVPNIVFADQDWGDQPYHWDSAGYRAKPLPSVFRNDVIEADFLATVRLLQVPPKNGYQYHLYRVTPSLKLKQEASQLLAEFRRKEALALMDYGKTKQKRTEMARAERRKRLEREKHYRESARAERARRAAIAARALPVRPQATDYTSQSADSAYFDKLRSVHQRQQNGANISIDSRGNIR